MCYLLPVKRICATGESVWQHLHSTRVYFNNLQMFWIMWFWWTLGIRDRMDFATKLFAEDTFPLKLKMTWYESKQINDLVTRSSNNRFLCRLSLILRLISHHFLQIRGAILVFHSSQNCTIFILFIIF